MRPCEDRSGAYCTVSKIVLDAGVVPETPLMVMV
jgi:hypothetical protein